MPVNLFLGRKPSQFSFHPVVKYFIFSETLLWAGWNFFTPIFAAFVITEIKDAGLESAATAYSLHLLTRIFFELFSARFLYRASRAQQLKVTVGGILLLSLGYLGLSFTRHLAPLFFFYSLVGGAIGLSSPGKMALFSMHLDKNKESWEWGLRDASVFSGMAFASALGGFVAKEYGFHSLFLFSALINLTALIPYFLIYKSFQSIKQKQ